MTVKELRDILKGMKGDVEISTGNSTSFSYKRCATEDTYQVEMYDNVILQHIPKHKVKTLILWSPS